MNRPARAQASPPLIRCDGAEDFADTVAARLAGALGEGVARRGHAWMALSGGRTPRPVYERLGRHQLSWSQVTATLADERWVPASSPDSNARLVAESLLAGPASACTFEPLWRPGGGPEAAAREVDGVVSSRRFDVVVLGMGDDGHTASLFPGTPELAGALDPRCERRCVAVAPHTPAPVQARLTLTLPALLDARLIVLLLAGEGKLATLGAAFAPGPVRDMPVRAVLRQAAAPVEIYWTSQT